MSLQTSQLHVVAVTAVILSVFLWSYAFKAQTALPRPTVGLRGLKRRAALVRGGAFALLDPLLRQLGAWVAELPIGSLRSRIDAELMRAGDWLGLCANEVIAMGLLAGLGSALGVLLLAGFESASWLYVLLALLLGSSLPWLRLRGEAQRRARLVSLALPATLDLVSLCLSAGLDLPSSLRQIVQQAPDRQDPMIEELARILRELELGQTRRRALEHFAERVPTDRVRELVHSIVQAEEKGNPVAELLGIQAQTQRLRRSIDVEESAAAAALMLMGPMLLIFLCVLVLLLGPALVRFSTGGFG